ncbi:MAG: glutamine amidotransferase [Acidimicrobiia bacterium]
MTDLVIVHLYPREMNIYGDMGNLIALRRRLEWRGMGHRVDRVGVGDEYDFTGADIVVAGGGEDLSQMKVAADLQTRAGAVRRAVDDGVVFLTVCGTYQLFGHRFVTASGEVIPGIGVFDCETIGGGTRMIGNIVVDAAAGRLVGFENHSGRTMLGAGQEALGRVVRGNGNNDTTGEEGAMVNNAFGTYLHGSVLPKNPAFADDLIARALRRRGESGELSALDDSVEQAAAKSAAARL